MDDFIGHFARGPIDDDEVEQYHKRFISTDAEDRDFDSQTYHESVTEYLRKLPEDEFEQEARFAVSRATPEQRQELLRELLKALERAGGKADIAKLRLGSTDPCEMSEVDAARLMNYARREHPESLTKVVEEKRSFLKDLRDLVVVGALAITAKRLAQRRKAEDGPEHRKATK
jgi:hypothetical protein